MDKSPNNILEQIRNRLENLSPKQRQLAEFILENYKKAAFMTSTVLGKTARVSETTVIRLADSLGCSGFPEFQSLLQSIIHHELTTIERFSNPDQLNGNAAYSKVFSAEAENIIRVLASLSNEQISKAVELLYSKKRVLVIGHQASACLASYAGYSLSKVRDGVITMNQWDENTFGTVRDMGPDDVAWVHAFPRYPNQTIRIAQFLQSRNVPIILITNGILSPFSEMATIVLPVRIRYDAFVDGLAPVMCLINSLVLETALKNQDNTVQHLEEFENFVAQTQIFLNDSKKE